jgi:hypothetical protein
MQRAARTVAVDRVQLALYHWQVTVWKKSLKPEDPDSFGQESTGKAGLSCLSWYD